MSRQSYLVKASARGPWRTASLTPRGPRARLRNPGLNRIQASKDRLCSFPTLFPIQLVIQYLYRVDGFSLSGQWIDGVQQRVILCFPISIINFVGKFLKTETYCWVRKLVRPWPYRTNKLRWPCISNKCHFLGFAPKNLDKPDTT